MQAITYFRIANSFPIMTKNIFQEPQKGFVSHIAVSRLLAEGCPTPRLGPARTRMRCGRPLLKTVHALKEVSRVPRAESDGFSSWPIKLIDRFMRFWICIRIRARRFGNAMVAFTSGTGYTLEYLVNGYDWSSIGEGLVVDVRYP